MSEEFSSAERHIRSRQTFRLVVWVVLLGVLIAFGVLNRNKVSVDWGFHKTVAAPLWAVIAISAAVGALFGFVARPRR